MDLLLGLLCGPCTLAQEALVCKTHVYKLKQAIMFSFGN